MTWCSACFKGHTYIKNRHVFRKTCLSEITYNNIMYCLLYNLYSLCGSVRELHNLDVNTLLCVADATAREVEVFC